MAKKEGTMDAGHVEPSAPQPGPFQEGLGSHGGPQRWFRSQIGSAVTD